MSVQIWKRVLLAGLALSYVLGVSGCAAVAGGVAGAAVGHKIHERRHKDDD
jgi:hypothetical protein